MDIEKLKAQLIVEEDLKLHTYKDTVGKLTIGVGRNLDDLGISKDEALFLLGNDIARIVTELNGALPWWQGLNDIRQLVLADMAFNLGIYGLIGFKLMLTACQAGDYEEAARQMLGGPWEAQVGNRARRLADMMRSGQD